MLFAKYWKHVSKGEAFAWGWSDESPEAAQADGERRLARIITWLKEGSESKLSRYGYSDRPMREEVLKEFHDADGRLTAAVSRNSYGCLVLNAMDALFVDIDKPQSDLFSAIGSLFRREKKKDFEDDLKGRLGHWVNTHPGWGWRAYRTKAGIRLLATHQPISSADRICQTAFDEFKADPLYRKLCDNQKCFRARLTPKPWRCGAKKPPVRWPWKDESARQKFELWERRYLEAAGEHATCALIGHFGQKQIHPALFPLVQFHDATTRAESGLPLA